MSENLSLECDCTPVWEAKYEPGGGTAPSEAVVDALAAAKDVDPLELKPLDRRIDVEALDRLFGRRNGDTESGTTVLSYTIDGWNLFVRDDGRVVVCDPDGPADPSPIFDRADGERVAHSPD